MTEEIPKSASPIIGDDDDKIRSSIHQEDEEIIMMDHRQDQDESMLVLGTGPAAALAGDTNVDGNVNNSTDQDNNTTTTNNNNMLSSLSSSTSRAYIIPQGSDLSLYFHALTEAVFMRRNIVNTSVDAVEHASNNIIIGSRHYTNSISLVITLWEGVGPILDAGKQHCNVLDEPSLASDTAKYSTIGGSDENDASSSSGGITPKHAALYLYAVAQNISTLESAVFGVFSNFGASASSGNKALTAKHVAEIISAVTVVATYCTPRSIITQSGILPALVHLIQMTGRLSPKSATSNNFAHALTPFHPEFLQLSLLAGQYRYAESFLNDHPLSQSSFDFPYLPIDQGCYLRAHYFAGLVHLKCSNWNAALDSFHLCLTMPCSTVSKIAIAARKKSLLVQCLLLESEELDGTLTENEIGSRINTLDKPVVRTFTDDADSTKQKKMSFLKSRVLELPGAASAAICKCMAASSNRVLGGDGGGSGGDNDDENEPAPERTSRFETSKQHSSRKDKSNRRRTRGSATLEEAEPDNEEAQEELTSKDSSYLACYHDLISEYISGNIPLYVTLLSKMTDVLHSDGNWGLAKQLENRLLFYRSIRKIASIYSVIGLHALEAKVTYGDSTKEGSLGIRGLESVLMSLSACDSEDPLIVDPFIAKIDQSSGMVSFVDDYDAAAASDRIDADLSVRLQSCMAFAERVRELDIAFTTSSKYLQHVAKEMATKTDPNTTRSYKQRGVSSVADFGFDATEKGH